jgi:hypothetical protein
MRLVRLVLGIAFLGLTAGAASAQIYAPESLERYFRVETHVERKAGRVVVWGYIYNQTNLHADRMTVRVDTLDAAGSVIGSTSTWVPGLVPANSRAYFEARAADGARHRVEVLAFDWMGRGGSSN